MDSTLPNSRGTDSGPFDARKLCYPRNWIFIGPMPPPFPHGRGSDKPIGGAHGSKRRPLNAGQESRRIRKMSTPASFISNMYACFGPRGWLAQCHPNYEFRAGQLQMAQEVEAAFRDRHHLLVEAGTGTGKTLAYLIPALASNQRVVISTGTKNLQDQLYYKDIPFLTEHLGRPLRVCYMKGRANYLCRQKVYEMENMPVLRGLEEVEHFAEIREWERQTETGDRSELGVLPED